MENENCWNREGNSSSQNNGKWGRKVRREWEMEIAMTEKGMVVNGV